VRGDAKLLGIGGLLPAVIAESYGNGRVGCTPYLGQRRGAVTY
jgi:hypothetical protein